MAKMICTTGNMRLIAQQELMGIKRFAQSPTDNACFRAHSALLMSNLDLQCESACAAKQPLDLITARRAQSSLQQMVLSALCPESRF